MKGRYINTQIKLACLSKKQNEKRDIHSQLKATIAEHKRIMQQFVTQTSAAIVDFELQEEKAA